MKNLKKEFRKIAKQNINSLTKTKEIFNDKKSCILLKHLLKKQISKSKVKNILVYIPLPLEMNIFPLILWLKRQNNVRIFTPFVIENDFKITPFRFPLEKNQYNIHQTKNSNFISFNKIDLSLVPILGVDIDFKRIGFGKGMYDRFYSHLKNKPKTIFISRILHFSNIKITDSYDIDGDIIISNKRENYDFISNTWIHSNRCNFKRPIILYNKKNLYFKAKCSY
ncbi:MAG: 5-formyltetrahydrofolate cyclo-ligase [Helicobacteraceae bacterium]|nr:5-formyltetrahydrofolate cyclo-ligase [Helicobacteraceae bacterium]